MDWQHIVGKWAVAVGAAAMAAWAHLGNLFPLLLALMVLDVVSGLLAAFVKGTLSSKVSWRGMVRKVLTLILVGMSDLIEPALGNGWDVSQLVVIFFIVSEGLSILENAAIAGVPIPPVLRDALARLDKQERKGG